MLIQRMVEQRKGKNQCCKKNSVINRKQLNYYKVLTKNSDNKLIFNDEQ